MASLLSCLLALAALAPAAVVSPAPADRVFLGGRVWTADPARPWAEAIAVRGPLLAAVGSDAEVKALIGPRTEVVDLGGRLATPGFNDAHLHFLVLEEADLDGATSVADFQQRLRDYAKAHPERAWVTGRGWGYGAFPEGGPSAKDVDAAVSDRPVYLSDRDGHSALVNARALALAGITKETKDPENGTIVRAADGAPTGLLKESAMRLVGSHVPPPTEDEQYRALKLRLDQAASYGLTSVQNASAIELPVYERVAAEGGLKVRVYASLPMKADLPADELARYRALRQRHQGPLIKYGAVKGFLDGVVDARTAAMLEPFTRGGTGQLNWTDADIRRTVAFYDREGFQVRLHACGDRAIRQALDAYAAAAAANHTTGRRHRVEHAEVPDPADLPRFRELGVVASTQAYFASPDQTTLENYAPLLGPARASRANAFGRFDAAGVRQAFGSDWPVFPMRALHGMYAAVARRTPGGNPPGGWFPENRIGVEAALRHFTVDAAYASFDEDVKGSLTPGKRADFVVLSEDVIAGPAERLLTARVLLTVMDGRDTHREPGAWPARVPAR
jgi:predicted amidohydrolase YtcJ